MGGSRKVRTLVTTILIAVFFISGAGYAGVRLYGHFTLQTVMNKILEENPNRAIKVRTRYGNFLDFDVLVFDIQRLGGPEVPAAVLSVFSELAFRMKEKDFKEVWLAWRGRTLLIVEGGGFKRLGEKFAAHNTSPK